MARIAARCGFALVLLCLAASAERTQETLKLRGTDAAEPRPFYWGVGIVNTYPGLASEDIINDFAEPLLNTVAPGFGGMATFSDLRDQHLFLPPQLTLGKSFGKHWAVGGHIGYSEGTVRTEKTKASLLFTLPFHLDMQVKRLAWYGGVDVDYYPFGFPELRAYHSLGERLQQAKFRVGFTGTLTYSGYDAKVQAGFFPLESIIKVNLSDRWRLFGICPNVGFDLPLGPHDALSATAGYTFFTGNRWDFEGWNITLNWRHYFAHFGAPKREKH